MRRSRHFWVLLLTSLSLLLISASVKASMWDIPAGLVPGDTFRWVFVTSTTRHALDTDIVSYNDFVNSAVTVAGTSITGIQGKSTIADIQWKVIGSTAAVNAIDNIGGASTSHIFTVIGDLVANGTDDLFDGDIASAINVDENGNIRDVLVWTGTLSDGSVHLTRELGGLYTTPSTWAYPILGNSSTTDSGWIHATIDSDWAEHSMYAISEELAVVPVPGAFLLGMLGLGVTVARLRKHT